MSLMNNRTTLNQRSWTRLYPEDHKQLATAAARRGTTQSAMLRQIVHESLWQQRHQQNGHPNPTNQQLGNALVELGQQLRHMCTQLVEIAAMQELIFGPTVACLAIATKKWPSEAVEKLLHQAREQLKPLKQQVAGLQEDARTRQPRKQKP